MAIWFSLAHIVSCSNRDLHKTEEEARERVRGEWYQVFESRIDELGDLKQRALEEMETVEVWAENTIQTITLKSFYDSGGIGRRFYYRIASLLRLLPEVPPWGLDIDGQSLKMKKLPTVSFKRRPEDVDGLFTSLADQSGIRGRVEYWIRMSAAKWVHSLAVGESTLGAGMT